MAGLDDQIRIALPTALKAELHAAAGDADADVSALVRACIILALPSLRSTPGLIPLCQPGVLRTSPKRG